MPDINQVFLSMRDEIERQAKHEEKVILEEVRVLEEEAYESMKAEAKRDAELKLKQDEEEMSSHASAEISESYVERTKKLMKQRDQYVKDIFDHARKELIAFVKSDDYLPFLLKKAEKVGTDFHDQSTLYLNSHDLQYQEQLLKVLGKNINVALNDEIQIGGFILENLSTHMIVDETLDLALNDQREWFNKNSGLMIK